MIYEEEDANRVTNSFIKFNFFVNEEIIAKNDVNLLLRVTIFKIVSNLDISPDNFYNMGDKSKLDVRIKITEFFKIKRKI